MRISTDPNDPAYVDERPRRVWCNDIEVAGWTVADEFRRCVITADGKVYHGSIRIERLQDGEVEAETPAAEMPFNACFSGVFVNVPDMKPEPESIEQASRVAAVITPVAAPNFKSKGRR